MPTVVLIMTLMGCVGLGLYLFMKNEIIKSQGIKKPDWQMKLDLQDKILAFTRNKKDVRKIKIMNEFNIMPVLLSEVVASMLGRDLIRHDEDIISITEFGKHYYDKFIKPKNKK